jgi:hypothetical protein
VTCLHCLLRGNSSINTFPLQHANVTLEELSETVFSVGSDPRLYNEN